MTSCLNLMWRAPRLMRRGLPALACCAALSACSSLPGAHPPQMAGAGLEYASGSALARADKHQTTDDERYQTQSWIDGIRMGRVVPR